MFSKSILNVQKNYVNNIMKYKKKYLNINKWQGRRSVFESGRAKKEIPKAFYTP